MNHLTTDSRRRSLANLFLLIGIAVAGTAAAQQVLVHNHSPRPVPESVLAPRLELQLYPDTSNGFNLYVQVVSYQLESPLEAGDAPPNLLEGHAHLLLNGKKRMRLYGPWYHLDKALLKPGLNQLTVTLNSHQHETWVIDKQPVLATVFFDTGKQPALQHRFAAFPLAD